MKTMSLAAIAIAALAIVYAGSARADECPRTIGSDTAFRDPWPSSSTWFGTETLAVMLPEDGIWPTTKPGSLIAVKLFWYSSEFQAAAEKGFDEGRVLGFETRIRRLDAGPGDAVISGPNWAGLGGLGENWTILTGIDFPDAGCWEITGEYLNQSLTFVVETMDHDRWSSRQ